MINENYPLSVLTCNIIGCAIEVHKFSGKVFQEKIYQRAQFLEMQDQSFHFIREKEMQVFYKQRQGGTRRVDFFVEKQVIVEIKAIITLEDVHLAQAINYLEDYNLPNWPAHKLRIS